MPRTAAEAQARCDAYLQHLADTTPRTGLSVPTAAFLDDLIQRTARYGTHLFVCFDDPRIPATTNGLEGLFGRVKHTLRHTVGSGSTTNTVASNLGAEVIIAYQYLKQPGARERLKSPTTSPADFQAARARLTRQELPGTRQRSMVRHLDRHLDQLRCRWISADRPNRG